MSKYFDITITANDVDKGKPDPNPYLLAIKKLNCKRPVVFEDSLFGIQSAKNAECFVVGIYTKGVNEGWIELADAWIDDYAKLISSY